MSHDAYAQVLRNTANPRDTEYRAFATSTRALLSAGEEDPKALAEALHVNRSLWEALASDCASDANGLPEELRARIVGLARFVVAHSKRVLRREETVDALVDINRIMMDGLTGNTGLDPNAA